MPNLMSKTDIVGSKLSVFHSAPIYLDDSRFSTRTNLKDNLHVVKRTKRLVCLNRSLLKLCDLQQLLISPIEIQLTLYSYSSRPWPIMDFISSL